MDNKLIKHRQELTRILSEEPVNIDKLKSLCKSINLKLPKNKQAIDIGIHKLRVNMKETPDDLRESSRKWLDKRGFKQQIMFTGQ